MVVPLSAPKPVGLFFFCIDVLSPPFLFGLLGAWMGGCVCVYIRTKLFIKEGGASVPVTSYELSGGAGWVHDYCAHECSPGTRRQAWEAQGRLYLHKYLEG